MKRGILLAVLAVAISPVFSLRRPLVCNNASEPTFGEIFHLLSPIEIDGQIFVDPPTLEGAKSFPEILLNVWRNVFFDVSMAFSSTKFPLAYLLSDGIFVLNMLSDPYGDLLADAVVIREKHWSQRYICTIARKFLPSHSSSAFCGCWSGVSLVQYYGERRAKDYLPGRSEHDWCVFTEPCQGQFGGSESLCRIAVDPLTSSCVASSKFSLQPDPHLDQMISYRLEMRTLKSQKWDEILSLTFLNFCHHFVHFPQLRDQCYSVYDYVHVSLLPVLCNAVPIYILNGVIAIAFLSVEESIASHPLLRFVVAVTLGLVLALVWAMVAVYRISHKVLNTDGIPILGNLIQPGLTAMFLGVSVLFTSTTVQEYLWLQIIHFWNDGYFGIPWLGKAYFLVSVGLSLLITYRYGFFVEGSFSHTLLRLLLRSLGGIMLLLRCSPNTDICIALGIAALFRDHILDLSHYLWITWEASKQTPTHLYSGQQPLTNDDYSHQGQIHTAAALKELRDYLQTPEGKAQSAKVSYRWREANRDDLSSRLDHFTKGLYSGRPSDADDMIFEEEAGGDSIQNRPRWTYTLFTFLVYTLVCLALSGIVALVIFDVGGQDTSPFLSQGRSFLERVGILQRVRSADL